MRIELETILTAEDKEPDHVVQGLIYQGQMLVMAGEPGVGKSFLMYTMGMSIAADLAFLGRRTTHGPVLYFDEENSRPDLQQYLKWIWRGLGQPNIEEVAKYLFIEHFNLAQQGRKRFEYMAKVAAELQPVLTIIDTASPVCDIKDENDNAEASRMIGFLRSVKESAGPQNAMVVLKHAKIVYDDEQKRTIRGAKAWLGALDGTLYHTLPAGQPRKDGLRNSQVSQDKVRAFGLRESIKIEPRWVESGGQKGVRLEAK